MKLTYAYSLAILLGPAPSLLDDDDAWGLVNQLLCWCHLIPAESSCPLRPTTPSGGKMLRWLKYRGVAGLGS